MSLEGPRPQGRAAGQSAESEARRGGCVSRCCLWKPKANPAGAFSLSEHNLTHTSGRWTFFWKWLPCWVHCIALFAQVLATRDSVLSSLPFSHRNADILLLPRAEGFILRGSPE